MKYEPRPLYTSGFKLSKSLIRHNPTGTILFMGKVMNPNGEKI